MKQAVDLLHVWVGTDVEDALELLGPTFENLSVRGYAVMQLHKADDEVHHGIVPNAVGSNDNL